ncbi:selenate reductase subunit YgfN [Escherichia coli]|uniref:Selenate reductase subunit YgfN n=1 Tax=Escherichia coli TaxID=562 RepID=A0A376RDJ3_ECOLX|nr:selenate reductase subunit YgfN [Escherichia coli]
MIIHFTLNGAPQELTVNPGENVQKLLFNMGMHSVRTVMMASGLPVLTQ